MLGGEGGGSDMTVVWELMMSSAVIGGEVGVVVDEELQIGFQLVNELFGQGL